MAFAGRLGLSESPLGDFQLGGIGSESPDKSAGDSGRGTTTLASRANIFAIELAIGLEILDAPIETSESGSGDDAAIVAVVTADSGTGWERDAECPPRDGAVVDALIPVDETALGTEVYSLNSDGQFSDAGSGSENGIVINDQTADETASAVESEDYGPAIDDDGTGAESISETADLLAADAGFGEASTVIEIAAIDGGTGNDIFIPVADGFGGFSSELLADKFATETPFGIDGVTIVLQIEDSALADDSLLLGAAPAAEEFAAANDVGMQAADYVPAESVIGLDEAGTSAEILGSDDGHSNDDSAAISVAVQAIDSGTAEDYCRI